MIHDILPVNSYCGNGSTKKFDFNFYIDEEEQLDVYLINSDNTREKLVLNADYEIYDTGNANGGFVLYPASNNSNRSILSANERISLELTLKPIQQIQYNNSSILNLESIEYSFDYLTRLVQILKRRLELCVKAQEGTGVEPDFVLNEITQKQDEYSKSLDTINTKIQSLETLIKNYKPSNPDTTPPTTGGSDSSCDCGVTQEQINNILSEISEIKTEIDELQKSSGSGSDIPTSRGLYIVESYTGTDKNYYYRKWSDGFIEQYVIIEDPKEINGDCTLPVAFTGKYAITTGESVFLLKDCYAIPFAASNDLFIWKIFSHEESNAPERINFYCYGY